MSTFDRHRPNRTAALTGGSGAAVCLAALVVSGRTLPFPTSVDTAEVARWARTVGVATVVFTGLRAVAVALFGWCALTWAVGVIARRARRPRMVAVVDRVSPRVVRHLAEAVAGLGIVVAGLSPAVGAGAAASGPTAAVAMVDLGPVMTDLGAVETVVPPSPTTTLPAPAMTTEEASSAPTWTIEPGDTLWHVAEVVVSESLGRPADTVEVARRLGELVTLNADRLAVPDDPALVFPGQVFRLG